MKIKVEKFWDTKTTELVENINDSLKRMEIDSVNRYLDQLFDLLKNPTLDVQVRISLFFAIEKIAQFEPFYEKTVEFLIAILGAEQNTHVKEFSVYILGNLVLNRPNLALITRTLPIFLKFCKDSSEYVRKCAEDVKNRLDQVKETKLKEKEIILSLKEGLKAFIEKRIQEMNDRANIISKEALKLDYQSAFSLQEQMVDKIRSFSLVNDKAEDEVKDYIKTQVRDNPIFEGEFKEELSFWKAKRAEKEDLVRQVHCIIRIQAKIFKIIEYIRNKSEKDSISIEELKKQTTGGLKGEWSDAEIIETLEKLVDEEIIPNLTYQQIKELKDAQTAKKKKKSVNKKKAS